jgi:signal transduction histidine kinase
MKLPDWPMERKIGASTLAIALAAIAFVSSFLILSEQSTMLTTRRQLTRSLVGMIANNAAAALLYGDDTVARQILAGTAAEPSARVAALYDKDGKLYVWFPADFPRGRLPGVASGPALKQSGDWIDDYEPVMLDGQEVGTAFLRTDLTEMRRQFRWYVITVGAVAAITILLLSLLARAIQRWISLPVQSLSQTAQRIAADGNYALRAEKMSRDEVGELVDAFNFMVQEIERSHAAIQRQTATLEVQVAERTAKLAATVNELESFSYSISHDMRGPLRAIVGYSEILAERIPPADVESRGYLDRMMRASTRMDSLIMDILNYSRVAKSDMQIAAVDLDALIDDVAAEYPQFAGADIVIQRPLGGVYGHKAALGQVLSNLLGNAIKFMAPGKTPQIRIWAELHGDRRRVFVQDNGIGIRAEDLARLFRIFERVGDQSLYPGTGVGLSIVRKALEKMNGTVQVESAAGQGSTFSFELKAADLPPPT